MTQLVSTASLLFLLLGCIGCGAGPVSTNSDGTQVATSATVRTPEPANSVDNKVTFSTPSDGVSEPAAINPLIAAREKRLGEMRKQTAGQNAPKLDIESILKQSTRPAPDNSEFSVALTDILVERRTFLKHPVLAKAEKITEGTEKALHVFTKDGRSFKVPGDRVESLSTASAAEILTAADIPLPQREKTGGKPGARKN